MEEITSFTPHISSSNYSFNVGRPFRVAIYDLLTFTHYHLKDTNKYSTVGK